MLTADLLRARVGRKYIVPKYVDTLDPKVSTIAQRLLVLYRTHISKPRQQLASAVDKVIGVGVDYKLWRGLAKCLDARCVWKMKQDLDPAQLRRQVFLASAARGVFDESSRAVVMDAIGREVGISAQEVEEALYADLEENHILASFEDMDPVDLMNRYNVQLAQAVLYRGISLQIELGQSAPEELRHIVHAIKFSRLMHQIRKDDETGRFSIKVDGPESMLQPTRRYGISFARFLPALLTCSTWKLEATIQWKKDRPSKTFRLAESDGLVSHYKTRGRWKSDEEEHFERSFQGRPSEWRLERVGTALELPGNDVLVCDYKLTHESGTVCYLEVIGFWRADYLRRRIAGLRNVREKLILVVGERLKLDREKLDAANAQVVFFKGVIPVKKVIAAADVFVE
jgi:uncharacterized protein